MRKTLSPLLLCAALLLGCAAQNPEPETTASPAAATAAAEPVRETLFVTPLTESGPLQRYSLSQTVTDLLPLGENLLLFSGGGTTVLTLLNPETAEALAVHEAPLELTSANAAVQLLDAGISYFQPDTRETVVLDKTLREIRRIAAPEELAGMPLLSQNGSLLYYCTAGAVRCMDLDSGISRVLKETAHPVQSVTALLLEDRVVQLDITDSGGAHSTLFLSSETGQLLYTGGGSILPQTAGDSFFLQNPDFSVYFGRADGSAMLLQPLHGDLGCWYLPDSNQAVACGQSENSTILELYDLESGTRTGELALDGFLFPGQVTQTADGTVWFLAPGDQGPILLRWDPAASAIQDDTLYISPRYTREEPDYEGLAACSLYAQQIGEKYGIEVLVYKDAVALEPWDYHLEYEYQASVLQRELEALDERLGHYPDGFLQTLAGKFTALKICIVRSAVGSPESGSLDAVNGIQFWDGYDACIVLAADHDTEYALYHELSHLIETVVLTESTAYDQWELLNPSDFQYDYDYIANQTRDGSPWLQPGKESFIDTYSMSFPKEDRARIMEYAMTPGHGDIFRSLYLQAKLSRICSGIREAFGLKKYPQPLLWEQYLSKPLV